jgi:hypothetical protein
MEYRRIYKEWLPQIADATPRVFTAQPGQPIYASAHEWRDAFIQFLAARLVVAENVQLDLDGTVSVTLAEAAISAESRLKGLRNSQLFSIENNTVDGDFVRAMQTDLQGFGGDDYLLDDMAGAFASLAASGQALQPLADWIAGKFLSSRNGTRSDAWISALFIQSYEMRCFVPAADVAARQAETEAWAEFLLLCPDGSAPTCSVTGFMR